MQLQAVASWLDQHWTAAEAGFVYRAWLDAEGDKELVHKHIEAWLGEHGMIADAQFVYKAWLEAGGDKELVHKHIEAWLAEHGMIADAHFVYNAWLDAGGDKELVHKHIEAWLGEHGTAPGSDFLYRAWLEAGGDFSLVKPASIQWMRENRDKKEAVYLSKVLAKQRDLPVEAVRDILTWCRQFPTDEDALWRFTQLRSHLLREEIAGDLCDTSEEIVRALISGDARPAKVTCGQINAVFYYLITAQGLRDGDARRRVDSLLVTWVRHPCSYGADAKPFLQVQQASYVQRIADLVVAGDLDLVRDREAVERFLAWVDSWDPDWKSSLYRLFDFLKHNYPATGLWEIVKFAQD